MMESNFYFYLQKSSILRSVNCLIQVLIFLRSLGVSIELKMFTENDNIYEGQFVNGKKEGNGIFYHVDSRYAQEGCWKNDICMTSTIKDIGCRRSVLYPPLFHIPRIKHNEALLLHS